jgi:serine protease Do
MVKKLFNSIKNNRSIIIVSACSSLLTILILAGILLTLFSTNIISLDSNFFGKLANQPKGTIKTDSVAEESRIINVVEKANPAVVSIIITKDVPIYEQYYQGYFPFYGFNTNQQNQTGTEKQEIGGGSGFFISSDGYLVTNSHVVDDEEAGYTVMTSDGKKYSAKVMAKDSTLDVAILKVEGKDFSYLTFADSSSLKLGQTVVAIGNALAEYNNSISAGIISGLSRSIVAGDTSGKSEQIEGAIQTDAAINSGNSGGPLLDIRGNVIGVNVAIQTSAENISFALPSNTVKSVVDSVKKYGEIVKPYLGVRYTQVTDTLKENNNLKYNYGVIVSRGKTTEDLAVLPGSPADKAGIVENDIILEVDGIKLDQDQSLALIIRQKQIDQTIKLKIIHDGDEKEVEVKLEKSP